MTAIKIETADTLELTLPCWQGAYFKPTRGKGRVLPASRHVWADPQDTLPDFVFNTLPHDPGQGACLCGEQSLDNLPIGIALGTQFTPAGPLLREAQGQRDLARAQRQAVKLLGTMQRNGARTSNATESDAIGDAVLAIALWRAQAGPYYPGESVSLVCWRALVASVARQDMLGETIDVWQADFDSLTGSAAPLPALLGDATRDDKASRLLFERARAKRPGLLAKRFDTIRQGKAGRGKRGEAIDKIQRACVLLLHGQSLDTAASLAGFKPSGTGRHAQRAGDRLIRAVRRLGWRVLFDMRVRESRDTGRRGAFIPIDAYLVGQWSALPSASLSLQNGRGAKQRVPLIRRLTVKAQRQAKLAGARAKLTTSPRMTAKRNTLTRKAQRQAKLAGYVPACNWTHDAQAIALQYVLGFPVTLTPSQRKAQAMHRRWIRQSA